MSFLSFSDLVSKCGCLILACGIVTLPMLPKRDSWLSDLRGRSHAWRHAGVRLDSQPSLQKKRVPQPHMSRVTPGTVDSTWLSSGYSVQAVVHASRHPGGMGGLWRVPGRPCFPWGEAQVEGDHRSLFSRLVKTRLASPQFSCS